jgi:hypothetical protein
MDMSMNEPAKLIQWLNNQPKSWMKNCTRTRIILRLGFMPDEIIQQDPDDPNLASEIRAIIEDMMGLQVSV